MTTYLINGTIQPTLTPAIHCLIKGAKKYLKICTFLFQEIDIYKLLEEAIDRGVVLFILTNYKLPQNRESDTTLTNVKRLQKKGAHIRGYEDLHAKFIISDGNNGIIMSANFNDRSLYTNVESGVLISGKEVNALEYIFEKLFNSGKKLLDSKYDVHITKEITQILELDSSILESSRTCFTIAANNNTSNLPHEDTKKVHSIYNNILKVIQEAKTELFITTWKFEKLNLIPEFIQEIKKACQRGVKIITLCCTGGGIKLFDSNQKAMKELESLGCVCYEHENNHSKCILSESSGVLFSANIDGDKGLLSGFEVGCVLNESERLSARKHIMELINQQKQQNNK